ncbi:MAG: hypothetical protein BGO93_10115 [Mesorhizobium sp. 65-26]|nr:MAG: hypothetical protein BGO93_10115 [Mesorhizobium sp. 65-26]
MDFAVVTRRFFAIRMFLVGVAFGRGAEIANMAATVVMRFLNLKLRRGVAVKTCSVSACEEAGLQRRHYQKHDRQHRAERRYSYDRDLAKAFHWSPWDNCSRGLSRPVAVKLLQCTRT